MLITPANLSFFFTDLETRYWTAYRAADPWQSKIATVYNVGTEQWVSGWIGMLRVYREWLGPRKTQQPAPQTYLVPIKNWELTEEIDEFKLADDQMGIYMPTVSFMGIQAKKLWDYKTRDLLQNQGSMTGGFQNGTDGLTYFNTAHLVNVYDSTLGTYCNDYRGGVSVSGTTVGGGFSTNGFNTVWEDHAARKSESGENLGIVPDLSMGPLQLKAAMSTVLQAQFYSPPQMGGLGSGTGANAAMVGNMDNPLKGWTDLFTNPDLTNANDWYMWTTKAPIKPISMLLRLAPDFIPRVTPNDAIVFNEHKILYGSKARGTPAWGFSWLGSIDGPVAGA